MVNLDLKTIYIYSYLFRNQLCDTLDRNRLLIIDKIASKKRGIGYVKMSHKMSVSLSFLLIISIKDFISNLIS